eukprot:Hpha_TRINITY_DN15444_c0_g8::TRINITY_DN15444_c0_g8_i1::g.176088::m.176088
MKRVTRGAAEGILARCQWRSHSQAPPPEGHYNGASAVVRARDGRVWACTETGVIEGVEGSVISGVEVGEGFVLRLRVSTPRGSEGLLFSSGARKGEWKVLSGVVSRPVDQREMNQLIVQASDSGAGALASLLLQCAEVGLRFDLPNAATAICHSRNSRNSSRSTMADAVCLYLAQEVSFALGPFNSVSASGAMYGLRCVPQNAAGRALMAALVPHVRGCDSLTKARHVANALVGLSECFDTAELRALLHAVAPVIARSHPDDFTGRPMGAALFGLRRLPGTSESRAVLRALLPFLKHAPGVPSDQALGNAVLGLQGQGNTPEVLAVYSELAAVARRQRMDLQPRNLGAVFFGVRLADTSLPVRRLIGELSRIVRFTKAAPDAQAIANALFGLQRQDLTPETHSALEALGDIIPRCRDAFTCMGVAQALVGLRLRSDSDVVRGVLLSLAPLVLSSVGRPAPQDVGDALFGLTRIGDTEATRHMLTALLHFVERSGEVFSPEAYGMALCGLQRHGGTEAGGSLFSQLRRKTIKGHASPRDVAQALSGLGTLEDVQGAREVLAQAARWVRDGGIGAAFDSGYLAGALAGVGRKDTPESRDMILLLTPSAATATLDPVNVGHVLRSLHGQSDGPAAWELMHTIAGRLPSVRMHEQADADLLIGYAVSGLQRQQDSPQARLLLAALLPVVSSVQTWRTNALRSLLCGLHQQGDTPEVRALLAAVGRASFRGVGLSGVSNVLYSLRHLPSSPEARLLLARCCPLLLCPPDGDASQAVGNATLGLQGQGDFPEVHGCVEALAPLFSECWQNPKASAQVVQGLVALQAGGVPVGRHLAVVAAARLPSNVRCGDRGTLQALLQAATLAGLKVPATLAQAALRLAGEQWQPQLRGNMSERVVRAVLRESGVPGLRYGVVLGCGFELDILAGGTEVSAGGVGLGLFGGVNVELDGEAVYYRAEGRRRLAQVRCEHLRRTYGIRVVRVRTHQPLAKVVARIAAACEPVVGSNESWRHAQAWAQHGWPFHLSKAARAVHAPSVQVTRGRAGKLVHWNEDKGYGFVRPAHGGGDLYLHRGEAPMGVSLRQGLHVTVDEVPGLRGFQRMAANCRVGYEDRTVSVLTTVCHPQQE